jgi:hypothetical protein
VQKLTETDNRLGEILQKIRSDGFHDQSLGYYPIVQEAGAIIGEIQEH